MGGDTGIAQLSEAPLTTSAAAHHPTQPPHPTKLPSAQAVTRPLTRMAPSSVCVSTRHGRPISSPCRMTTSTSVPHRRRASSAMGPAAEPVPGSSGTPAGHEHADVQRAIVEAAERGQADATRPRRDAEPR